MKPRKENRSAASTRYIPYVLCCVLALCACGFEPVYGTHSAGVGAALTQVHVSDILGRDGQLLRIALEDQLNPTGAPANAPYDLKITLTKTIVPTIVRTDGSIERYSIHLHSHFSLIRVADGKEALGGDVNRISSSNVPNVSNVSEGDFASYVAQQDAVKRTLDEMAEEYRFRLTAWLGKNK